MSTDHSRAGFGLRSKNMSLHLSSPDLPAREWSPLQDVVSVVWLDGLGWAQHGEVVDDRPLL